MNHENFQWLWCSWHVQEAVMSNIDRKINTKILKQVKRKKSSIYDDDENKVTIHEKIKKFFFSLRDSYTEDKFSQKWKQIKSFLFTKEEFH